MNFRCATGASIGHGYIRAHAICTLAGGQRALSIQFEKRSIMKLYIAWVEGRVELDKGEIDLPLRKDMEQAYRHAM